MDEELANLIAMYNFFLKDSHLDKYFSVERLSAEREGAYRWEIGVCDPQDVKTEVGEYLKLLKELTNIYDVRSVQYSNTLNAIATAHNPLGYVVPRLEISEVISLEMSTLEDVRKELKKHPHRAGMRIKDVDAAIYALQEKQAGMLDESELAD